MAKGVTAAVAECKLPRTGTRMTRGTRTGPTHLRGTPERVEQRPIVKGTQRSGANGWPAAAPRSRLALRRNPVTRIEGSDVVGHAQAQVRNPDCSSSHLQAAGGGVQYSAAPPSRHISYRASAPPAHASQQLHPARWVLLVKMISVSQPCSWCICFILQADSIFPADTRSASAPALRTWPGCPTARWVEAPATRAPHWAASSALEGPGPSQHHHSSNLQSHLTL